MCDTFLSHCPNKCCKKSCLYSKQDQVWNTGQFFKNLEVRDKKYLALDNDLTDIFDAVTSEEDSLNQL